jgi:ribonuclease P protein component
MSLETLKKRSEFLKVRGGRRYATPAFVLEGKLRSASSCNGALRKSESAGPRFGFTVTKKLGGAVTRNRIRRRLKAAAERAAVPLAHLGFDYVVVARSAALDRPFETLLDDFSAAVTSIHGPAARRRPQRKRPRS